MPDKYAKNRQTEGTLRSLEQTSMGGVTAMDGEAAMEEDHQVCGDEGEGAMQTEWEAAAEAAGGA